TCNDGNACTQSDTCQAGTCTGANPVVCPTPDQCHDPGTCAPGTGVCSNPQKTNGTTCNDGDACTQTDTCQTGSCTGSNPVLCSAQDQCHVAGTCAPATGACSNPQKANGTGCNDGNACTQSDTCQAGTCTGANPVVCPTPDQCHVAGTCAPATGVCSNPTKTDGTTCNDSNSCTQSDACQGGVCTGANPVVCPTPDQCHNAGTCSITSGTCSNPSKPDGTGCNDGNGCTLTDTCQTGSCTGTTPVTCTALSQCYNAGVCQPASGTCTNPPKAAGTSCNDGNACTTGDACNGSGSCSQSSPLLCLSTTNPCKVTTCDVALGCVTNNRPNGTTCNDGTQCTRVDTCQSGTCVGGSTRNDANGDWNDAPGGQGSGPTSIDVMTMQDGTLATVGVYTGAAKFGANTLGYAAGFSEALYLVTYKESGSGGAGTSVTLLSIGRVGSAVAPGTFTVGGAAISPDDSFTVVGTFVGSAHFGLVGNTIDRDAGAQSLFVARYAPDGSIKWVATGDAKGTVTGEVVGAFQNGSVVVSGVVGANALTITDSGGVTATVPAVGVYAVRFAADGSGVWAHRVATRGTSRAAIGVRAVTTHSDGSFTLLGAFTVSASLGINAERTVATAGGSDAWLLRLEPNAAYRWGGRLGGTTNENPGDVEGLDADDVLVAVGTTGATPTLDTGTSVSLHTLGGGSEEGQIVRLDKSGGALGAALIAEPKGDEHAWVLGYGSDKSLTVSGSYTGPMSFYEKVGFGTGAPSGTPFVLANPQNPTLFVSRFESSLLRRWTIPIGGTGSQFASQTNWDIVAVVHPSLSVTVAGMFQGQSTFGNVVTKTLLPADKTGSPFIVHIDSEQALDYCP
ncbi:MAG TPA: hypothetical protein VHE30_03390, partial [Polyangiaceae bacterium]|nr:hypothetical protein [Polyangiaceae bacterium]